MLFARGGHHPRIYGGRGRTELQQVGICLPVPPLSRGHGVRIRLPPPPILPTVDCEGNRIPYEPLRDARRSPT